jgi:hypothetical protein
MLHVNNRPSSYYNHSGLVKHLFKIMFKNVFIQQKYSNFVIFCVQVCKKIKTATPTFLCRDPTPTLLLVEMISIYKKSKVWDSYILLKNKMCRELHVHVS